MPKVSIITPSYESSKFIAKAINSVLGQSLDDWEMIVVDDCSADDSAAIVSSFAEQDARVKLIELSKNSGAAVARNEAIKVAQGRYIAFLDSDDIWQPEKLKSQITFMESERVLLSYGDYTVAEPSSSKGLSVYSPPLELSYNDLLESCPIGCLTAAYDQEVLGKRYMPLVRRGQDWGLWLAITRNGIVAKKYPGNHAIYNEGGASLSKNKIKKFFNMYEVYRKEERLGLFTSWYCLCRHASYVREKNKNLRLSYEKY